MSSLLGAGVAGLYDYGPTGAALQANIISEWRKHFILEEDMLEVDPTIMTLDEVLKTSGHVEKFSDYMCRDTKTGDIFRADHLIEGVLEARLKGDAEARALEQGKTLDKSADAPDAKDDKKTAKKKKIKSTAVKLSDEAKADIEYVLAQIDNYTGPQLGGLIKKFDIRAPETGNEVTEPVEFNLMFSTEIGPTGTQKGYLRPETAQGHFVNFARLLEFNNGRIPFASAHVGKSFRNEISPRAGLLRVREFVMGEIEHFVDPDDKSHPRFLEVADLTLPWLPKGTQESGKTDITHATVGDAVAKGMCDNETLGYFVARIWLFLAKIGMDTNRIRFRQHMNNEMAHYASDCWDAEIKTSYGWIECVGCADRSAYDLTVHARRTKKDLSVHQLLTEPKVYEKYIPTINKKLLGPKFKKDAKAVEEQIIEMDQAQLERLAQALQAGQARITINGQEHDLSPDLVTVEHKTVKEHTRTYVPNVIEPSFGMGRIFYALLEHAFWSREEDAQRGVLSLPPLVAPFKALIVPISSNKEFQPLVREVTRKLRAAGVASRVDDSNATIGRRYSRNDELGTPFACTLDFASLEKGTMTLRERDTTSQLIGPVDEVIALIKGLSDGTLTWDEAQKKLPVYSGEQDVKA